MKIFQSLFMDAIIPWMCFIKKKFIEPIHAFLFCSLFKMKTNTFHYSQTHWWTRATLTRQKITITMLIITRYQFIYIFFSLFSSHFLALYSCRLLSLLLFHYFALTSTFHSHHLCHSQYTTDMSETKVFSSFSSLLLYKLLNCMTCDQKVFELWSYWFDWKNRN